MTHEVHDFESCIKAYRKLSDPDSLISVFSNPEDHNLITVFELTKSHDEARTTVQSEAFRGSLKDEGVNSEPTFSLFDVKFRATVPASKIYRPGVSHEVDDFEYWKGEFDKDEAIRIKANLELRALSTGTENLSMVCILFATGDLEHTKRLSTPTNCGSGKPVSGPNRCLPYSAYPPTECGPDSINSPCISLSVFVGLILDPLKQYYDCC